VFGCLYSCNIIYLSAPVSFLELGTGILALKKRKNKEKEKEKKMCIVERVFSTQKQ